MVHSKNPLPSFALLASKSDVIGCKFKVIRSLMLLKFSIEVLVIM